MNLVRSAAEMCTALKETKTFAEEQDVSLEDTINRNIDRTDQKSVLSGPRPQHVKS